MKSNVEFYRGLCRHLPEEAARMIADSLPLAEQIATKADLAELRSEMLDMKAEIFRWMLTFNVTLFLGLAGMIVAVVLKG